MNLMQLFWQGDGLTQGVALVLLVMSVASWVVLLWKAWLLKRASVDVARCTAAFWQSASVADALEKLKAFDRERLVLPMVLATNFEEAGTLATAGDRSQQLTRVLRDALHLALAKLQYGQVLLATVGSTAPFVGLVGTVVGIVNAFQQIAATGQGGVGQVSAGIAEALVTTAFGIGVAIPAVWLFNHLTQWITRLLVEMECAAEELAVAALGEHGRAASPSAARVRAARE